MTTNHPLVAHLFLERAMQRRSRHHSEVGTPLCRRGSALRRKMRSLRVENVKIPLKIQVIARDRIVNYKKRQRE